MNIKFRIWTPSAWTLNRYIVHISETKLQFIKWYFQQYSLEINPSYGFRFDAECTVSLNNSLPLSSDCVVLIFNWTFPCTETSRVLLYRFLDFVNIFLNYSTPAFGRVMLHFLYDYFSIFFKSNHSKLQN